MFEQYTYKQKFFALIVIFVLLLFASNKRSFSVTKDNYDLMKKTEEKLNFITTSNSDFHNITSEIAYLDAAIGKQGISPETVQQSILDFSSQFDYIKVANISEIHYAQSNGFDIFSNQLVLEGNFNDLSKVIYEFEKNFKLSKIVSINYQKIKNYNTRRDKLQASIIFQNYEKIND